MERTASSSQQIVGRLCLDMATVLSGGGTLAIISVVIYRGIKGFDDSVLFGILNTLALLIIGAIVWFVIHWLVVILRYVVAKEWLHYEES